ncbi:MAG TPA: hypothetical protein VEU47_09325 [Candidatus Cybelea sp.]|nr:hypothetical protein [Candidatus Cybelea sp.]
MRALALIAALLPALFLNLAVWYWPNRPMPLVHPSPDTQLAGLSFAPFHAGFSPLDHTYPNTQQIDADLRSLKGRVGSVRTYTSLEGMAAVPTLAHKYGIDVIQSAWLGVKPATNEAEVKALIELANRYPGTIKRVIVGNEVLLRADLTPEQLTAYIRQVKRAVHQPVSYADVWEFWLRHPEIGKEVDFITIHLLPYWEDFPIPVDHAQEHILAIYRKVQAAFPGKPVFIGEVGWPSAGRTREGAVPGRVESAQFLNDFLNLAAEQHLDYNYVETYDQFWKTAQEGTVGGTWGLFEADGTPKFTFSGPVQESPDWWMGALGSSAAAAALAAWLYLRRPRLGDRQLAGAAVLGVALAGMVAAAALHGFHFTYYPVDKAIALLMCLWQGALAALLFSDLLRRCESNVAAHPGPARDARDVWADFKRYAALYLPLGRGTVSADKLAKFAEGRWVWAGEWLLFAAAPLAFYQTFMLLVNGRYRDFPINDFLVPAFGFVLARAIGVLVRRDSGGLLGRFSFGQAFRPVDGRAGTKFGEAPVERVVAIGLLLSSGLLVMLERPVNHEADYWAVTAAVISLPYLLAWISGLARSSRLTPARPGKSATD